MSTERYSVRVAAPDACTAPVALDRTTRAAGLPRPLLELIKMRASPLNGCADCLDRHGKDALALGIPTETLVVLDAWRDAPFYTAQERAALAWTEALTLVALSDVSDTPYEETRARVSEAELAALTSAIVVINGWNRIAISTRLQAGHDRSRPTPAAAGEPAP